MTDINGYSKSGSKLLNVDNMPSRSKHMPPYITIALAGAKAAAKILFKEFGFLKGLCILFQSIWHFFS